MTIQTDVQEPTAMSDDAAIAALVNQMKVAPKAPTANSGEDDEDPADLDDEADENDAEPEDAEEGDPEDDGDDEDVDPDADEAEDEGEDEPAPPEAVVTADDAVVKVTVNGEETEVTIGSLKRLAGQEATLTRKSQEADAVGGRAALMIQGALDTIVEDLEPYKDLDWLVAQQEMDPEEFKWHRENFTRSERRYNTLIKQAGEFEQVISTRKNAVVAEQAKAAHVELAQDIPGWNEKLYGDIMQYGVSQGLSEDDVASITSAKVIKILHKAMLSDTAKAVVAKKVNKTPVRVRKAGGDEPVSNGPNKSQRRLEQKMASGRGTDDDAVALLMGRWKAK